MTILAPSILNCDLSNIQQEVTKLIEAKVDWLHFDVCDGHFVNNISFGPSFLKSISSYCSLYKDVHLMISNPSKYVPIFVECGANSITFHLETTDEPLKIIEQIKVLNCRCGLAIKPGTNVQEIIPFLPLLDLVLVMSVEPGFGGQSFIESTFNKIKELKDHIVRNNYNVLIEVDGGINNQNSQKIKMAGADVLVVGSYLFKSSNLEAAVMSLR